jgi:hypothetical protein
MQRTIDASCVVKYSGEEKDRPEHVDMGSVLDERLHRHVPQKDKRLGSWREEMYCYIACKVSIVLDV